MAHIMLDIETLGTRPGCVVLSIGAVVFDPVTGETGETFYRNIMRASCEHFGLVADPDTVAWWAALPEAARAALMPDQIGLFDALTELNAFWRAQAGDRLWSQGPSFDPVILQAAYDATGLPAPWRYNAARDTRTVHDLAGFTPDKTRASLHNALEDAKAQAADVHQCYVALGLAAHSFPSHSSPSGEAATGGGGPLANTQAVEGAAPLPAGTPETPPPITPAGDPIIG
ncbi:MAG: 3'-5' exoribonuclease, partial [Caulobacter sp.]|nr:3'-5' exoribonuclease [Caulobacter sp.]